MSLISVVINTLNEEEQIAASIESTSGFADEVIVCDMESSDRTREIAGRLGARVITLPPAGYMNPGRLRAVSEARGPWIFILDADERMTEPLKERLREIARRDEADAVTIAIKQRLLGDFVYHGGCFTTTFNRFFKRHVYLDLYQRHEQTELTMHREFSSLFRVPRRIVLPKRYHLTHLAYPSVQAWIDKALGRYAWLEAKGLYESGVRFSAFQLIWQPLRQMVGRYLWLHGYQDGLRGLILAGLHGCYYFVLWAHLWELSSTQGSKKSP